ncbi:rab11 family-interacting protein 4 isoform X2 [Plodia interpunctella]|uniref:rab11 family-interacting protein 4 isoform X2 n=1 Tax=Plodia interpunctella TaxID=58824 RepID=UPI00236863C7|nr:rab11 family-interacting protein 4 isoform X2 [Plodia interpunctella]
MPDLVVLVVTDGLDVLRLLERWWQTVLLAGRLLLCYWRMMHRALLELKMPQATMMAPSVFQRNKSPRSSPGNLPRKLQNGAEPAAQSDPQADSSPGNSISDAENFECYGEADGDAPANSTENGTRSPGSHLNRHSWTRTSLRRTPPSHQENLPHRRWGSMRHSGKRQIGSNVLASQLYRSSSFNSSGCGSGGEPTDDMYSDVSLEEDVQGLNYKGPPPEVRGRITSDSSLPEDLFTGGPLTPHLTNGLNGGKKTAAHQWCDNLSDQVLLLQQQVTSLADTQSTADERYARAKADNAVLQARLHMLDEQIREIECRCEERIADEQKRCRDAIARVERERDTQQTALNDRLAAAEAEASDLKQEVGRLRGVAETLRANADIAARAHREAQEQIGELVAQLTAAREAERKEREAAAATAELLASTKLELQRLREAPPPPPDPRLDELRRELTLLRTQNKSLSEAQEELQAQILTRGVEEGRSLLDGVSGPLVGTNSLAHELSQMSDDELQKALKEQQDVNVQLRNYIDGILLAIVENYPQLLEVKYQKEAAESKS